MEAASKKLKQRREGSGRFEVGPTLAEMQATRTKEALDAGDCPGCWGAGFVSLPYDPSENPDQQLIPCPECYKAKKTFTNFDPQGNKDLKRALKGAMAWAEGKATHLVLVGPVGTGKSHLARAAVAQMQAKGISARYHNVGDMIDRLRAGYKDDSYEAVFTEYTWSDPLVMDDLGEQRPTPNSEFTIEVLERIVDMRLNNECPTMFTTNYTQHLLAARTSLRLASRVYSLKDGVTVVLINAEDQRGV